MHHSKKSRLNHLNNALINSISLASVSIAAGSGTDAGADKVAVAVCIVEVERAASMSVPVPVAEGAVSATAVVVGPAITGADAGLVVGAVVGTREASCDEAISASISCIYRIIAQ